MRALSRVLGIGLALTALTSTPMAAASPQGPSAVTVIKAGNAIGPCLTELDDGVVKLLPCLPVFADSAKWFRSGATIRNTRTGNCLEIDRNPVKALRCKPWNFIGQTWDPTPDGKIVYLNSTFCLTANHEARVPENRPCNGSPQQTWLFRFN